MKNLYKKLVDPKEPLKCIPLNSVNPAYNPYHPLLIKTSNSNRANVINNMGTSYGGNTNNIMKNINNTPEEDGKVQQCGIVYNMKDSSISCSVKISNTTYESYYFRILSTSSSDSKSLSFSESGTFSNSSERILTNTEGKVTFVIDSDEDTHSDTHESSYASRESEEHSHAMQELMVVKLLMKLTGVKSEETTHIDEYSQKDINNYRKAKSQDI
eukprot:jgi/Orpsp1_1/1187927/evm.model.d7180000061214.1